MSRGAHRRFGYESLLVMLAWYFLGAAVAAGSAISSGLFVPMLMMGAIAGRLVGLATTDIADKYGQLLSRKLQCMMLFPLGVAVSASAASPLCTSGAGSCVGFHTNTSLFTYAPWNR